MGEEVKLNWSTLASLDSKSIPDKPGVFVISTIIRDEYGSGQYRDVYVGCGNIKSGIRAYEDDKQATLAQHGPQPRVKWMIISDDAEQKRLVQLVQPTILKP